MEGEYLQHAPESLQEITKFISQLWLHPLLDKKTLKHRQISVANLNTAFSNRYQEWSEQLFANCTDADKPELQEEAEEVLDGIVKQAFGVLTGSSLWATNSQSDGDFLLFHDPQSYSLEVLMFDVNSRGKPVRSISKHEKARNVHIIGDPVPIDAFHLLQEGYATPILFTPDEYIALNQRYAQEARLKCVNYLAKFPDEQLDLLWFSPKSPLTKQFNRLFKQWGQPSHPIKKVRENSVPRFQERLDQRAEQAVMPADLYRKAFMYALNKFTPPSFQTYAEAITSSQGALRLDNRYAATATQTF